MVVRAIKQSLLYRIPVGGMIFHSDRGSQYASVAVRNILNQNKIIQSINRKGNCYYNTAAESFFHTLKVELIYTRNYLSREEARTEIFEYIEIFYNRQRRRSTINYYTPVEFEERNIKLVA